MVAASKTFTFFALRNYQADVVAEVFQAFAQKERTVVQIATGAGKTAIGAAIADRFVKQKGRVLWLAHREELLLQAYEKLEEVCIAPVALIQSGKKIKPDALIQVASVQTVSRRSLPFDVDLIVTDEAHHAVSRTYLKVYEQFPQAYQLGLTATPKRLDGKGLNSVFDRLVSGISLSSLIEQKYLCPYRLFAAVTTIETKNVRTVAGDFNLKQLRVAAMSADVMGEIVPTWRRYAAGRQTVVFCCDIEHSLAVCELYQNDGILAAHLDGNTPPTLRRKILADFADRTITVLVNCGIISEGLDIPGIECVQILRPTQSLALDLQMLGRSLRPAPGKTESIILDHTKNWKIHGLPDDDRAWSLDGTVQQTVRKTNIALSGEVTIAPTRAVVHDESAELVEVTRAEIEEATRKMKQIASSPPSAAVGDDRLDAFRISNPEPTEVSSSPFSWIDALFARQRACGYEKGWVGYQVLDRLREKFDDFRKIDQTALDADAYTELKHDFFLRPLEYVARMLEYQPSWANRRYDELCDELEVLLQPDIKELPLLQQQSLESSHVQNLKTMYSEEREDLLVERLNTVAPQILASLLHHYPAFKQIHENCKLSFDSEIPYQPFDDAEITAEIHLAQALPQSCQWFCWMQEQKELLRSSLKNIIKLPEHYTLKLNFSCVIASPLTFISHCSKCASSRFYLLSASPPHYARLECQEGHFIQWVSQSRLLEEARLKRSLVAESAPTFSLFQIWQAVLYYLKPHSTQAMVRQQMRLSALSDSQAIVQFDSQPLMEMAVARLPNIEAAFRQALGREIQVNLEVVQQSPVKDDRAFSNLQELVEDEEFDWLVDEDEEELNPFDVADAGDEEPSLIGAEDEELKLCELHQELDAKWSREQLQQLLEQLNPEADPL